MTVFEAVGLAAVALVVILAVAILAAELCGLFESPIRRCRKLRTPPCRLCAYSSNYGYCVCPAAVEREERLSGDAEWRVPSGKVRGTRVCAFEAKKEEEE